MNADREGPRGGAHALALTGIMSLDQCPQAAAAKVPQA